MKNNYCRIAIRDLLHAFKKIICPNGNSTTIDSYTTNVAVHTFFYLSHMYTWLHAYAPLDHLGPLEQCIINPPMCHSSKNIYILNMHRLSYLLQPRLKIIDLLSHTQILRIEKSNIICISMKLRI